MTLLVASTLVVVIGLPVLLMGLVYTSRRVFAQGSMSWSRTILRVTGVRLTIEGTEHIASGDPMFFMGNHESALDIPILIVALRGDVRFMAKHALFRIPIFGWVIARYGYIPIHRSSPRTTLRTLNHMIGRIQKKPISLVVFPEGTRTRDDELLPFRKGTMKIGQRVGLPIVPFSIEGAMEVIHRDEFRAVPGPVRLTFAKPIPAEEVAAMSPTELGDRVREAVLCGLGRTSSPAPTDDASLMTTKGT